ncbi:kinase-like domain-containing protein [Suillus variegatus]|nr:kinase-like domain-containing protein [Suillus variegatus]
MSFSTLRDLTSQITRKDPYPLEGGAFGTVWRCILRTEDTEIEVAVKTLRMHSNGRKENVHRELAIWRRLNHENIVPLLGIASGFGPDNSISMVSIWFTNGTLTSYLARQRETLHHRRRLELLRDIAAGVQYLHESRVVHGDLSGNNVLINGQGKACLTDFGLSTASGGFQGTSYFGQAGRHGAIRWVAPEIIVGVGQHSTFESDIYSFGSIMLQVLSGEVPWSGIAIEHVIVQKLTNGQVPRRPSIVSRTHWAFHSKMLVTESPKRSSSIFSSICPRNCRFSEELSNTWQDVLLLSADDIMIRLFQPGAALIQFYVVSHNPCATNIVAMQENAEPNSNDRFLIPNENVSYHAFVHDDTTNADTDVENMNDHPVISQDVDFNQQSLQASASANTHLVLKPREIPRDFEGDLVNQISRLHAFAAKNGSSWDTWQCHLYTADLGKVQVAVKAHRGFDASNPVIRKRLLRACRLWIKLEHRNIVHIYGMTSGFSVFPAVVTTWMRNGTLTEYLNRQYSYLTSRGRSHLLNDVASGLCYLHSQDIVHGSLTGSNVLIDESGGAYLTDYGLAYIIATSGADMRTSTTETYNSPNAARWAAPELILSEDSDDEIEPNPTKFSDVYSFGCIMLQILVGRLPYWWLRSSIPVNSARARGIPPMKYDADVPKLEVFHQKFLERCWESLPLSRPSSVEAAEFAAAELQGLA